MNKRPHRVEKVNDSTLRIIVEKAEDVPVEQLYKNLAQLESERDRIIETIENVKELIKEATDLGINIKTSSLRCGNPNCECGGEAPIES